MNKASGSSSRKLVDRIVPEERWGVLQGFIATTYEMQPEFLEMDFLPSLFALGAWDDRSWASRIAVEKNLAQLESATIFMEARKYRGRPRSLRLEVIPVAGRAKLHAKGLLLVYEKAVRLLVSSANLTSPGYRFNREVAAVLVADKSSGAPSLLSAIDGLELQLRPKLSASASTLLALARQRLDEFSATDDRTQAEVIWSGGDDRLFECFADKWPTNEPIERISIVSPFWSEDSSSTLERFLERLGSRVKRPVEVRLLTEASFGTGDNITPVLPPSYAAADWCGLGARVTAQAVDPQVLPEEISGMEVSGGRRRLQAKVVVLEGASEVLAYLGSANFTASGLGTLARNLPANIEAGIMLRARKGDGILAQIIPQLVGEPIVLDGGAEKSLVAPEPITKDPPWPGFIELVELSTSLSDENMLELAIFARETQQSWSAELLGQLRGTALIVRDANQMHEVIRIPLASEWLQALLSEQEVLLRWSACPEGRAIPVNVEAGARLRLPIAPSGREPGESDLIAFYQGRISWEQLFPDPNELATGETDLQPETGSLVDKTRIQTYQVREFVEALPGLCSDLRKSAISQQSIRLAFLGPVSPIALAESVVAAGRTPMATAFQLIEILNCLRRVDIGDIPLELRATWNECLQMARKRIDGALSSLIEAAPEELGGKAFRTYHKTMVCSDK